MLALALLASHLVGDFIFQTRWQSAGKFGWTRDAIIFRATHCFTYALAFMPVVVWRTWGDDLLGRAWHGYAFLFALFVLHFLTDSRRFTSTIGDWIGWRMDRMHYDPEGFADWELQPLPINPWPTLPLAIDQTLHVVQLAALGWLLT